MKLGIIFVSLVLVHVLHGFVITLTFALISTGIAIAGMVSSIQEYKNTARQQKDALEQLEKIVEAMGRVNVYIDEITENLNRFADVFEDTLAYELSMTEFTIIVAGIGSLYQEMLKFMAEPNEHDELELDNFVNDIVSHSSSGLRVQLNILASYLHSQYNGFGSLNIVAPLLHISQFNETITTPVLKTLYDVYNMAELQGVSLFIYAYNHLERKAIGQNVQYGEELRMVTIEMQRRLQWVSSMAEFEKVLYFENTFMPFCVMQTNTVWEKRIELVGLERAVLFAESDLDGNGNCSFRCADYTTEIVTPPCKYAPLCRNEVPPCEGKLVKCQAAATPLTVCNDLTQKQRHFITSLQVAATDSNASTVFGAPIRSRCQVIENDGTECGICLCQCVDENVRTQVKRDLRRFNMRPVLTEHGKNMVLTGARFVEKDGMIYTQIRQSVMVSPTSIDQTTHEWLPIKSYNYEKETNNEDYFEFSYKSRSIAMDLINSTENSVITGIAYHEDGGTLVPRIRTHSYSTEGQLNNLNWQQQNLARAGSVYVADAYFPLDAETAAEATADMLTPNSENETVTFKTSTPELDVAQTVYPFFDGSEVVVYPAVPLRTFGLYYKSLSNRPGFIGIVLAIFNVKNYIMRLPNM